MIQDKGLRAEEKDAYKMPRVHEGWEAGELTSRQKTREDSMEVMFDFTW